MTQNWTRGFSILALAASEAASAETPSDDGCPARVAEIPQQAGIEPGDPRLLGDRVIVVLKSERRLMIYSDGELRHDRDNGRPSCFHVALAPAPAEGPKRQRGDLQTPVGWYFTSDKPWSSFEHAIAIHYPNDEDARIGLDAGRIDKTQYTSIIDATRNGVVPPQNTRLGGQILIHGGGSAYDWTLGCIALEDEELMELRSALPTGMRTRIAILP